MSEHGTLSEQRLLALQRYIAALEEGDMESLATVLFEASHDQVLTGLLEELDTIYMEIDGTTSFELEKLQARVNWPVNSADSIQQAPLLFNKPAQPGEKRMLKNNKFAEANPTMLLPSIQNENRSRSSHDKKPRWRWPQTLAAILVACFLLGAVIWLHSGSPLGKGNTTTSSQPPLHSIVAVASYGGQVYGLRSDNGKQVWKFTPQKVQGESNSLSRVIIQGQSVYILVGSQVYGLRAADGKQLWHISLHVSGTSSNNYYNAFLFDQGMLYVSGNVYKDSQDAVGRGKLFALRSSNGSVAWQRDGFHSPILTAHNGIVYVVADDQTMSPTIRALRGKDGKELWRYSGSPISASADNTTIYIFLAHSLATDPEGFHKDAKTLVALNSQNGSQRWSIPIESNGAEPTQLDHGRLIQLEEGNTGAQLCAYQANNGHQIWCREAAASQGMDIVTYLIVDNVIYQLSDGKLLIQAYKASDGKTLLWKRTLKDIYTEWYTNSAVSANGHFFIRTSSYVWALDSSGHVVWRFLNPQSNPDGSKNLGPLAEGSW